MVMVTLYMYIVISWCSLECASSLGSRAELSKLISRLQLSKKTLLACHPS